MASEENARYVLDSYAILAYFQGEPAGNKVGLLLNKASQGKYSLYLSVVNLGEVAYIVERERGLHKAQQTLARIDELPIEVIDAGRTLTLAAAHLKTDCPIAYADCFAAALAQLKDAALVTGDPEFSKIGPGHNVRIAWLSGGNSKSEARSTKQ